MHSSIKRQELINVSLACPERPYLELEIPPNAKTVHSVNFTFTSHDQGWCDTSQDIPPYEQSYTWFAAYAKRVHGQKDPQQMQVQKNRRADENFYTHTIRWTDTDPNKSESDWVKSLKAGDTVQLLARAHYPGWVNIVKEAEIQIEWEPGTSVAQAPISHVMHPGHNKSLKYEPLDPELDEIRLLEIYPGTFDDPIRCSLVHTSIKSSGRKKFEALSYCWGDGSDRTSISLHRPGLHAPTETQPFNITKSAETAIRYLRRGEGEPRTMWIDAICINQGDVEERNHQVSMMADIYAKADQVNIWLGEADPNSALAIQVSREVFNSKHHICPGGEGCRCSGTRHRLQHDQHDMSEILLERIQQTFNVLSDRPEQETLFSVTTALLGNPWFRRVWVFQEALGGSNAIAHCGRESIPFDELVEFNSDLGSLDNRFRAYHMAPQAVMPSLWTSLIRGNRLRKERPSYAPDLGILDVYIAALELEASDPRDKLYALLSFSKETKPLGQLPKAIRPDYEKPPEQVRADFTRWWISEHKSLRILSAVHGQAGRTWQSLHCTAAPPRPRPPNRPSWAIGSEGQSSWANATLQARFGHRAAGSTAVFFGGDVPFLLRRASDFTDYPAFEFVGECYLQGIMNGEYIEEQRERMGMPEVLSLV